MGINPRGLYAQLDTMSVQTGSKTGENRNKNVRVALDMETEGSPPFFHAPYPDRIVQVKEGDTEGERNIIEMVNEYWPKSITELEDISEEEHENGYSGSFIRNVLRSHYVPMDLLEGEGPSAGIEVPGVEQALTSDALESMPDEEESWHKIFRMGLRAALQNGVEEEDAMEAFGSGFIEGAKLKEEL